METDPFIQALHRFMARLGKVTSIRSVNGTNLVGTDNELRPWSAETSVIVQHTYR